MRTFSDMRGANWSVGSLARRPNPEGLYVVADAGIISKGEQGVASPRKFAGLRYGTGTTGMHQHREGWGMGEGAHLWYSPPCQAGPNTGEPGYEAGP